jgi:hypothetical protein
MVAHWAKQVTETCVTNVELTNVELGQLEVVFLKFGSLNFSELLSQLHAAAGKGWVNRTTAGVNFDQDDFAIFRLSFDVSEDWSSMRCFLR